MAKEEAAQGKVIEQEAGAISSGFIKAVKALQVYGPDHATFRQFFTPAYQNLSDFLKKYHEVRFQIEQDAIAYRDRVLYQEQESDMGIPFRLFRDGIRDVEFSEGLSPDELLLFLDVISQTSNEYDVAVGLWEADFTHISFYVVEEADELSGSSIPDEAFEDIDYDQKMSELLKTEDIDLNKPLAFQLSPDELEHLKRDISDTKEHSTLPLLATVLADFILDLNDQQEIIGGLKKIVELCVEAGDFAHARKIINKLQGNQKICMLRTLENEEMIMSLRDVVTTAEDTIFDEFLQFIGLLSKGSVPYLFKMMGGVTRRDRLTKLHEKILDMVHNDPLPVATALSSREDSVVMNAITVLTLMRSKEAASYLQPLVHHGEPLVRARAVTALESLRVPSMIVAFLDDSERDVRTKALSALTAAPYSKIYAKLFKTMQGSDFLTVEPSEQKAYFDCLIANGGDVLAADLKKILYKRSLFGNERYHTVRTLAASALTDIGSEESLAILKHGTKAKVKDIRNVCQTALSREQKNPNE
jgi:hypothetical protein